MKQSFDSIPSAVQNQQEEHPSATIEVRRELAHIHAEFYVFLLKTLLNPGISDKEKQITETINKLPIHLQELYKKGFQQLLAELQKNTTLLNQHRGNEITYLVNDYLRGDGVKDENVITEALHSSDDSRYFEPMPGLPIIRQSSLLYDALKTIGLQSPNGFHTIIARNSKQPSYIFAGNDDSVAQLPEDLRESSLEYSKKTLLHELHHFVWAFLEKSTFARESNEQTPQLRELFDLFRHEIAAHIIGGSSIYFASIKNDFSANNKDAADMIQCHQKTMDYISRLAESENISDTTLLYPIMTSRNFDEMLRNSADIVPAKINEPKTLRVLYESFRDPVWGGSTETQISALQKISSLYNISLSLDIVKQFCADVLKRQSPASWTQKTFSQKEPTSEERSDREIDFLTKFFIALTGHEIDKEKIALGLQESIRN